MTSLLILNDSDFFWGSGISKNIDNKHCSWPDKPSDYQQFLCGIFPVPKNSSLYGALKDMCFSKGFSCPLSINYNLNVILCPTTSNISKYNVQCKLQGLLNYHAMSGGRFRSHRTSWYSYMHVRIPWMEVQFNYEWLV